MIEGDPDPYLVLMDPDLDQHCLSHFSLTGLDPYRGIDSTGEELKTGDFMATIHVLLR